MDNVLNWAIPSLLDYQNVTNKVIFQAFKFSSTPYQAKMALNLRLKEVVLTGPDVVAITHRIKLPEKWWTSFCCLLTFLPNKNQAAFQHIFKFLICYAWSQYSQLTLPPFFWIKINPQRNPLCDLTSQSHNLFQGTRPTVQAQICGLSEFMHIFPFPSA